MRSADSRDWKSPSAKTGSGSAACAARVEPAQGFNTRHLSRCGHRRSVIPDRGAAVSDVPATSPENKGVAHDVARTPSATRVRTARDPHAGDGLRDRAEP